MTLLNNSPTLVSHKRNLLRNFTKLFDGTLGVYSQRKIHIDIMPGSKPKHVQPYTIARIHLKTFKKELDHLVCIGVLSPQGASKWGSCPERFLSGGKVVDARASAVGRGST